VSKKNVPAGALRKLPAVRLWPAVAAVAFLLVGCGAGSEPKVAASSANPDTRDAAAFFADGREAAERGDAIRAEQYLSLALAQGYERSAVIPLLLQVCIAGSHLRAALNHAEPYLRQHPDDQQLRYLVATIHLGLGQREEARTDLEQLLRANPDYSDAHFLLGVLESDDDESEARAHLLRYLELAPKGEHAPEVRSRLSEMAVHDDRALRVARETDSDERGPRYEAEPRGYPSGSGETKWLDVRAPRLEKRTVQRENKP
jgi:tetratricopeptide (TPR) repeat protein